MTTAQQHGFRLLALGLTIAADGCDPSDPWPAPRAARFTMRATSVPLSAPCPFTPRNTAPSVMPAAGSHPSVRTRHVAASEPVRQTDLRALPFLIGLAL